MPMVDYENQWNNTGNDEIDYIDTWHWWNTFRLHSDFNSRFQLALELTADLPAPEVMLRWLGEPIETLIISTSLFITNRNNFPVLPYAHKMAVLKFLAGTNCKLALKPTDIDNNGFQNYVDFCRHLYKENAKKRNPMIGYVL